MSGQEAPLIREEMRLKHLAKIRMVWTLLALALLLALPSPASCRLRVIALIFPIYDWAREVGGERVEVTLLLPGGVSPHSYEPTPRDVRKLSQADIFLRMGLGLDAWSEKLVTATANRELLVVTLSEGLPPLRLPKIIGLRYGEELHEKGDDPHMWLDPLLARRMVLRIAEAFARKDPEGRDHYARRAHRFREKLLGLHKEIEAEVKGFSKRSAVTFHSAFAYLFRRYGIELAAVLEPFPGREPSPLYLKELVEIMRRLDQRVIFTEPQFSPKVAEVLAKELNGRVETLDPLGGPDIPGRASYLELMRYNLKVMKEALK